MAGWAGRERVRWVRNGWSWVGLGKLDIIRAVSWITSVGGELGCAGRVSLEYYLSIKNNKNNQFLYYVSLNVHT